MKKLNKNEILELIDVRFHSKLLSCEYEVDIIDVADIDLSKRVDILLKIELINALSSDNVELYEYYKELYLESIALFTDHTFIEPGNSNKNTQDDYLNSFINLYENIKTKGFDFSIGVIPFSGNTPLDGAHRTALAYVFNCKLSIVKIDVDPVDYGIDFFYKKGASERLIHVFASLLIKYDKTVRAAVIWPTSGFGIKNAQEMFGDTYIFGKEMKLTEVGVNNLCISAYKKESWIGGDSDYWKGAWGKSTACFDDNQTIITLFKPSYVGQDLEIKNKIRRSRNGTKHCVHSTDGSDDTADIINCTFPVKSELYLNSIKIKEMSKLRMYISNNDLYTHIVSGSSFMGVLGIRENEDVDTISTSSSASHNSYAQFFSKSIDSLFLIEECQYKFLDIRFLDLDELLKFKLKRNENKDIDDVKLIKFFINKKNNGLANKYLLVKRLLSQKIMRFKRRISRKFITFLKWIELYDAARWVYKKLFF
ncbi:hypothetical protein [Aeromonas veronii]|uniref:hypothetical protein n=1 Tax=Aeromonas veronii TaxID=654 RepID=UPI002B47042C|nr:hypothetical protein [Aeromonas veronii]